MRRVAAGIVLMLASIAHAQPGQQPAAPAQPVPPQPDPSQVPPQPAPPAQQGPSTPGQVPAQQGPYTPGQVVPTQPPPPSVMARPWSVELMLGFVQLEAKEVSSTKVDFGFVELAVRYRFRPALEVDLALIGGGADPHLSLVGFYADFRYRFLAESPWNIFAIVGLGGANVANKEGTKTERKARGSLRFGAGVERRFRAFAVDARILIFGVGENTDVAEVMPATLENQLTRENLSGGSLAFGASYYF